MTRIALIALLALSTLANPALAAGTAAGSVATAPSGPGTAPAGDYDSDGRVDAADFQIWRSNKF